MLTDAAVAEFVDLADKAIKEITVVAHHDVSTIAFFCFDVIG